MQSLIGTFLGQYQLTDVIGRGSTSTVYKAYQPSLHRHVAIKVLLPSLDPSFGVRFEREAQAIAQLQHPNILPIYDYGDQNGQPYLVTQYIPDGITLSDLLDGTPLEERMAVQLMIHLLHGLDYAHAQGVIHRDIKPSNILLPLPTWPLLADWGIAKLLHDERRLTPPGQAVGTALYMSPEQANGQSADARSDLYAAGVVFFQMLTGHVPFDGPTPLAVLMQHLGTPLPSPRSFNPALPPALESVLLQALAKDPTQRYQHADEFAQALEQVTAHVPIVAPPQMVPAPQTVTFVPHQHSNKPAPLAQPTQAPRALPRALAGNVRGVLFRRLATTLLVLGLIIGAGIAANFISNVRGPVTEAIQPTVPPTALANTPTTDGATAQPQPVIAGATPDVSTTSAATASIALAIAPSAAPPTQAPTGQIGSIAKLPDPTPVLDDVFLPTDSTLPTAAVPQAPLPTPAPPVVSQAGNVISVQLDDGAWRGGWQQTKRYAGRTATWVYGTTTQYHTMRTVFPIDYLPTGTASFTVVGMDSEGGTKTPITISVNDQVIYTGDNLLPDDDQPLDTGTWDSHTWTFDAAKLRPGQNVIAITNRAPGAFSLPPFFMLDYAQLSFATVR